MFRRGFAVFAAAGLVAISCAAGTPAATYDVTVDNKASAFNFQATAYFPNELKAHPGDTIRFTSIDRGEPHTVTFGTLVDAAVPKLKPGGPPTLEPFGLPDLIGGQPPAFVVSQAAAQPCFLASGAPPKSGACSKEQQTQPAFDGTQVFVNSGYLADKQVFALKLADSIKPGTYNFLCLLHGATMTGKLAVVDKSQATQTTDEVKAKATEQLNLKVQALQSSVDAAKSANAANAFAGIISEKVQDSQATLFGPTQLSIPLGGSVTWRLFGPHTISFNAPADATGVLVKAPDGGIGLNLKALAPVGWPGPPPPPAGAPPPAPNAPPQTIPLTAPAWDGKGFHSSGLLLSFPPTFFSYKLTFTQAGTYPFKCVIHPDMEGTVKVGQ